MKLKAVKIYRCRNCGKEIRKKSGSVDPTIDSRFVNAANEILYGEYFVPAFFHECTKLQVGYCELIKMEVENEELEKEKIKRKNELKDITAIIKLKRAEREQECMSLTMYNKVDREA